MKKKMLSLLVAVMLLLTSGAYAQSLPCACEGISTDSLERYAGFCEQDGMWSVHGVQADAALSYLSSRAVDFSYDGACLFYLEVSGSEQLGILLPRLVFYYVNNTYSKATAVSLSFGGMRYDLDVACETTTVNGRRAEKLTAYMDEAGLEMLRQLQSAEEVELRLHGAKVYTTTIERRERYVQSKDRLQSASLDASADMLNELDKLGLAGYKLWDKSQAAYEQLHGGFSPMTVTELAEDESEFRLDDEFNQLASGDMGLGVRELQELLVEKGFMLGMADNAYGEMTSEAVARVQRFYGLMETGTCDRQVIDCLLTGEGPAAQVRAEAPLASHHAQGLCEVALERCYVAQAVATSARPLTVARSVVNTDNRLVVVEGQIVNLSVTEMNLYWQLTGTLSKGGYEFPVEMMCESSEGLNLDSALLPLAKSRLVITAEIPASALGDVEQPWVLKLNLGSETVEYALDIL